MPFCWFAAENQRALDGRQQGDATRAAVSQAVSEGNARVMLQDALFQIEQGGMPSDAELDQLGALLAEHQDVAALLRDDAPAPAPAPAPAQKKAKTATRKLPRSSN